MDSVADGSVALVVTSPPYFAGKQYEQELEREGIPASYLEYLEMLTDVFRECVRTLEPGGRIAVNVANLGRKPYRSLSADVIRILEHDLGLLLRGEVIWQKGDGASGSCAWGSFRSAANPVLRDISERIIVASKGRFDRAHSTKQRSSQGLPFENTIATEDFMALTLDVWSIPAESARRVGHPAPFPVELPEQLIRLYTFAGDLVLDPFMGSGSALVAASRLGRRYVGYDLDPSYVEIAKNRVEQEGSPAITSKLDVAPNQAAAAKVVEAAIESAGFTIAGRDVRIARTGVVIPFVVADQTDQTWHIDVAGPNTSHRAGMARTEVVWKTLGRASATAIARGGIRLLVLTAAPPRRPSEGDTALRAAGPTAIFDVINFRSEAAVQRLAYYATSGGIAGPEIGFWTSQDLKS